MSRSVVGLLLLAVGTSALIDHHHTYGGHYREYVLCSSNDGDLYYYKSRAESEDPFTNCERDVARAKYVNSINQTGWAMFDLEIASDKIPDWLQGYAAGFLEGRASRALISAHTYNLFDGYCKGAEEYCKNLYDFLLENLKYMKKQIENNENDLFWRQVNITLSHLVGMIDGYEGTLQAASRSDEILVQHPIYLIQLQAEVWDLEAKFERPKELSTKRGHCSAIVKVNEANTNLLFSHVTWDTLQGMLRLQKRLRFKLRQTPGRTYTFTGYPGTLASVDDFYLTSAQLAILETTNEVYDKSQYVHATAQTVPTWIRSQVATRLAASGEDWVTLFSRHNSGTYNNQWVIVDYKLFRAGTHTLPEGLLHVVEQMPGSMVAADKTAHLNRRRYWPGYNRPYFTKTFEVAGNPDMVEEYGEFYSYNRTARARIFARDHKKVKCIDTLRKLMRYNDFMHDPLSRCEECDPPYSAEFAIASRNDLNPADADYPIPELKVTDMAATDVKMTDAELMRTLSFEAVSGPPHDDLPVFVWSKSQLRDTVRHVAHPDRWDFKPVRHIWQQRSLYA